MFGNSLVSVPSTVRRAALAGIICLTFTFIGVVAVHAYSSETHSGTVGGVGWSAFDSIEIAPGNGGTVYTGISKTQADQGLTLNVSTSGREICGWWVVDTDWGVNHTGVDTTIVSIGPISGWAGAGQCSWWFNMNTIVSNYAYHQAVNGWQTDEVHLDASEFLPN